MATLVLSTVGTALGGPVGGAIGALIGQSIDQQLLSPPRRGPRVGDLSVQSSSYGSQIPRIYGAMRVAGTVIWATDLTESEQTSGAKGQPDVVYSYSVSLAVALSSRPASSIGRIWADGKLLRGAEGDFKVPTTFRFHDGGESQDVDPLIASAEGIANTPAYRGLAIAMFENLELATFGNRIPFMTFELIADSDPPTVSSVLEDAAAGAIACDGAQPIGGYAAYGRSIAAAVQPLVDCFDIALFDDGSVLRGPLDSAAVSLAAGELGNSADGRMEPKFQRDRLPVRAAPSELRLTYYDTARDYQTGEARAIAGEPGTNEAQQELPGVLSADAAKTLAQRILARQWAARDRLTLRLPPARLALEPGSLLQPGVTPPTWRVEKCTVDGFVSIVELRPCAAEAPTLAGDAGRIVPSSDVVAGPISLAIADVPDVTQSDATAPFIMVAASCGTQGWSARALTIAAAGQTFVVPSAARKSLLGTALTPLDQGEPHLIDCINSVDVELIDPQQWLTSCDEAALAASANLAVLGSELIQFGAATPIGAGKFRLEQLLRGRAGTEWAAATHVIGEPFCLLDAATLRRVDLPASARGSTVSVSDAGGAAASCTLTAETIRPLSPVQLTATLAGGGGLAIGWRRRSRIGLSWLDEVDAPIGESREAYRVTISGASATLEFETTTSALDLTAGQAAQLGAGPATIMVQQLGDWAASRPAQLTFVLP